MAVDLRLWAESYRHKSLPHWPCPNCGVGRLGVVKDGLTIVEPKYSRSARSHNDWDPEWTTERFSAEMICSNTECQEIVFVTGETEMGQIEDEDHGWVYASQLRPRSVFPAPPIISIPKECPAAVRKEIEKAFQLFWTDLGASAGSADQRRAPDG